MKHYAALLLLPLSWMPAPVLLAQEAASGIDLRATVTGEVLESRPGFRAVFYPTVKLSEHWSFSGAIQIISRPYFSQDFDTPGYGAKGQILHANVTYSKVFKKASVVLRAGELSTAFGSFLLRYDDADNPLLQMPVGYGYYGPVTAAGLAGAQADVTLGKWDARAQFVNSSPGNPRSVFEKGQYGNWAGGIGYTIRQGFRVGISSYRGPYLNWQSPYFFPGESDPKGLPATALGVDAQWAHGHWNLYGEWEHFEFNYHVLPTYREHLAYFEAKRVLHPRWYVAARANYSRASYHSGGETYEASVGFRPDSWQLIKVGYSFGSFDRILGVQVVTTLHPLSQAWH